MSPMLKATGLLFCLGTGAIGRRRRGMSVLLSILALRACVGAATLPADIPINKEAGRGGFLIVNVRMGNGPELPMLVDTGAGGTELDTSLEPQLGKQLGTVNMKSWGVITKENVYAMPKLYMGGVELVTDNGVATSHFDEGIKGILGYDCLRHYCVQLDFEAGKVRFIDRQTADKREWGKAFPIVPLNANDARPAVAENLLGQQGPHSLIDVGCANDGWLMTKNYERWVDKTGPPPAGEARAPFGMFGGKVYPLLSLNNNDVESDGIGLRFLARHLVTLDFPDGKLYLLRKSAGPLPDPDLKLTAMPALNGLVSKVIENDAIGARTELAAIEKSRATELEKTVAGKLEATLEQPPKASPAEAAANLTELPLGDSRPDAAEVGYLEPAANRVPLNGEIPQPFLDCGSIYATGFFAHSPSRYAFDLGGKWKRLRGEAGLHTAFQGKAYGVIFVIRADGKEVFRSNAIRGAEHASYDLDMTGVKKLELVVENAADQNGCNWALWLDPTLGRE